MEQPGSTNPREQPAPSLDDEVASLLASVKPTPQDASQDGDDATAGEGLDNAMDERAEAGSSVALATEDVGDVLGEAAADSPASDEAQQIASLMGEPDALGTGPTDTLGDVPGGETGNDAPVAVTKINGDTAAIDAQLDVLTRQAADLASLADAAAPLSNPEQLANDPANDPTDNPTKGVAGDVSDDVARVMHDVAAEIGADLSNAAAAQATAESDTNLGTQTSPPSTAEDAAAHAAELLAMASAAVAEATGARTDTPPEAARDTRLADEGVDASANVDPAQIAPEVAPSEVAPDQVAPESSSPEVATPISAGKSYGDQSQMDSIKSLDEQIAQLSDDLLNQPPGMDATIPREGQGTPTSDLGAAAIAAGASRGASVAPTSAPALSAASAIPAQATPSATPQPTPSTPSHSQPPLAQPTLSQPPLSQPAPAPASPAHAAAAHPASATAAPVAAPVAAPPKVPLRDRVSPMLAIVKKALGALGGVASPLIAVMGKPLAKKPRIVRDSIGWIAVNTVFCASCLWGYMLFLRPADLAEQHAAFDIAHSELPEVPEHGDAHGAADAHGGADAHGAEKDDGHGAKKDDGHGGGHGDAKAGGAERKAHKPPSRKPPTKAERAKAKPKEEAKSGGH